MSVTWLFRPHHAAARRLAFASAAAWLSFTVVALAIVLQVIDATGSYSAAGYAVAAYGLAAAFAGIPRSRLVDRHGPRRTLPALTALHVAALILLATSAEAGAPVVVLVALSALASAATPPLIGVLRARWKDVVEEDELPQAYALTATLGDAAQVLGPPLAAAIATAVAPAAGLMTAGALAVLGTVVVLVTGSSAPPPQPAEERTRSAVRFPGLRTITIGGVAVGMGLGALDVLLPVLAADRGEPWAAGVLLGVFAVGSVIGSLNSPKLAHVPADARYLAGLAAVAFFSFGLVSMPPIPVVAALLLVCGLAWGVTNVVLYELLDKVVPESQATEAWTWLSTAEAVGMAAGAALAGVLAESSIPAAFSLVPAGVMVGLLVGMLRRDTLGDEAPQEQRAVEQPAVI